MTNIALFSFHLFLGFPYTVSDTGLPSKKCIYFFKGNLASKESEMNQSNNNSTTTQNNCYGSMIKIKMVGGDN